MKFTQQKKKKKCLKSNSILSFISQLFYCCVNCIQTFVCLTATELSLFFFFFIYFNIQTHIYPLITFTNHLETNHKLLFQS